MSDQEASPWAADDESEARLSDLAFEIGHGAVLALVGSGLSRPLGYPDWRGLVEGLAMEVRRRKPELVPATGDDMLWVVERHRRALAAGRTDPDEIAYYGFLDRQFSAPDPALVRPAPYAEVAKKLLAIPFRHFLTTNYDLSLQQAFGDERFRELEWDSQGDMREFLHNIATPGLARCVVHLHGWIKRPRTIVLSERDYVQRYAQSDSAREKLFAIFSTQRIAYVGFSLSDPDLMQILRSTNARLGRGDPFHWALLRAPRPNGETLAEQRERLKERYGVWAIYYRRGPDPDPDHEAFPLALDALARAVRQQKGRAAAAGLEILGEVLEQFPATLASESVLTHAIASHGSGKAPIFRDDGVEHPERLPIPSMPPPNDPQKHRWGGQSRANGLELGASVLSDSPGWFRVTLWVKPTSSERTLEGTVRFHLHDSFVPMVRTIVVRAGRAEETLSAWGAFTVGAEADGGETRLELDLAELPDAPQEFKSR
ncbi:MAG TPA: SIR2 family protein [Myxococcota bacterium]|jgi:hypothetical protein|nr:SIR2 family protein [Myxococcota bacterium]